MRAAYFGLYMRIAQEVAAKSWALRRKVGCVIVSPQDILAYGWNGMPSGWPNECESIEPVAVGPPQLTTKKEVLHAESNAISKAAREGFALRGGSLFVTCSPCLECSKLIMQTGIARVIYQDQYRTIDGVEFLNKCGIEVIKWTM